MILKLDDLGITLDIGNWAHKYVEEIKMHAARRDPNVPFPNLKIETKDTPLAELHDNAETLVQTVKESLPPEAVVSLARKFKVGENEAISIDISGRVHEGKYILIIMDVISIPEKLAILSYTLEEKNKSKYAVEFEKISKSLKVL